MNAHGKLVLAVPAISIALTFGCNGGKASIAPSTADPTENSNATTGKKAGTDAVATDDVVDPQRAPIPGGFVRGAVEVVQDDFVVASIIDAGDGKVVLVDAGISSDSGPLMAALRKRRLGPESVKAVFLTHGDLDHTRGVLNFPGAEVMALRADVGLVEGKVPKYPGHKANPTGIKVTRILDDGEVVVIGNLRVEAFAVPGHTPGSAAFLAAGALFLGDSAGCGVDGSLLPGDPKHTVDKPLNRKSLKELADRLQPRAKEIEFMVPSHTKSFDQGLGPLIDFAAKQ